MSDYKRFRSESDYVRYKSENSDYSREYSSSHGRLGNDYESRQSGHSSMFHKNAGKPDYPYEKYKSYSEQRNVDHEASSSSKLNSERFFRESRDSSYERQVSRSESFHPRHYNDNRNINSNQITQDDSYFHKPDADLESSRYQRFSYDRDEARQSSRSSDSYSEKRSQNFYSSNRRDPYHRSNTDTEPYSQRDDLLSQKEHSDSRSIYYQRGSRYEQETNLFSDRQIKRAEPSNQQFYDSKSEQFTEDDFYSDRERNRSHHRSTTGGRPDCNSQDNHSRQKSENEFRIGCNDQPCPTASISMKSNRSGKSYSENFNEDHRPKNDSVLKQEVYSTNEDVITLEKIKSTTGPFGFLVVPYICKQNPLNTLNEIAKVFKIPLSIEPQSKESAVKDIPSFRKIVVTLNDVFLSEGDDTITAVENGIDVLRKIYYTVLFKKVDHGLTVADSSGYSPEHFGGKKYTKKSHKNMDPVLYIDQAKQIVKQYADNYADQNDIKIFHDLKKNDRMSVEEYAGNLGLNYNTTGDNRMRFLLLSKPLDLWGAIKYLLETNNPSGKGTKYKILRPGEDWGLKANEVFKFTKGKKGKEGKKN